MTEKTIMSAQQQQNQNDSSALLTNEENEVVFTVIGHRKQVSRFMAVD